MMKHHKALSLLACCAVPFFAGCANLAPDYVQPPAPVAAPALLLTPFEARVLGTPLRAGPADASAVFLMTAQKEVRAMPGSSPAGLVSRP